MKLDRQSILGLLLGVGAVLGTQMIEGGHPASLAQGPAAIIVLLGTLGATLLSSSTQDLRTALHELRGVFRPPGDHTDILPARFRDLAFVARKDGLVSLDRAERTLPTPFMRRSIRHVIDGCEAGQLRSILEADTHARMARVEAAAEVFEVAGGYAPTMGILGAVLGLIRAMESLSDPDALGMGIAIAFVATIYGVGIANLFLLPVATRIRQRVQQQLREDEMIIVGTVGLQAGVSPRTLERTLQAHLTGGALS